MPCELPGLLPLLAGPGSAPDDREGTPMHLDSRNGIAAVPDVPTATGANPTRQVTQGGTHPSALGGLPSLCEDFASRLELAAVVDVDQEVRDALATLGEWMRTGEFGTREVAHWLVGSFRFRDAR
jgi:hypothetical protein